MIARRSFLTGFASLIASPAIVRASSLMPVKAMPVKAMLYDNATLREWLLPSGPWKMIYGNEEVMPMEFTGFRTSLPAAAWRKLNYGVPDFDPAFLQHIQKHPIEEARRCHS